MKLTTLSSLLKRIMIVTAISGLSLLTHAATTVSFTGSTYQQNFNTLAGSGSGNAWVNGSTLTGWYWHRTEPGTPPTVVSPSGYNAVNGSGANQGNILSLGTTTADRAFGGQNNNTVGQLIQYGVGFTNSTVNTLTSFSLSYSGEQYRAISGSGANDKLTFEYQIFAAGAGSLTATTGWTSVSALDFLAPVSSAGNVQVDGNVAGKVAVSGTVSGITWGAGTELWLRWTDTTDDTVNNPRLAMMGIDDVVFNGVPEPQVSLLLMIGTCLALGHRRRTNYTR